MGKARYADGFKLTLQEDALHVPLKWRTPRRVFVNSMSDLFHPAVPDSYILRVFEVMVEAHNHQFQVLTKRSERLRSLAPVLPWPPNVWMGVSIESMDYAFRADDLRSTEAKVKFLSCEPLLGSLAGLNLDDIGWLIAGGESGPGFRPPQEEWFLELRDKSVSANIPFFFKQWGGTNKKKTGRLLEGQTWSEFPETEKSQSRSLRN